MNPTLRVSPAVVPNPGSRIQFGMRNPRGAAVGWGACVPLSTEGPASPSPGVSANATAPVPPMNSPPAAIQATAE